MRKLKVVRGIIYLLPVLGLLWVFYLRYFPHTSMTITCRPGSCSKLVEGLTPPRGELFRLKDQNYWINLNHTFALDGRVLQPFRSVDVELTIPANYPSPVQVGMGPEQAVSKNAQLLYFNLSDLPEEEWNKMQNNDFMLFFRSKFPAPASIEQFLEDLPPLKSIAQFGFDFRPYYKIPGYVPDDKEVVIEEDLVGPHKMLTYVKDEPLNVHLKFFNRGSNREEPVTIEVTHEYGDREVLEIQKLKASDAEATIKIDGLREGTYGITFDVPRNIVLSEIRTRQNWLAFDSRLSLAATEAKTTIFSGFQNTPNELTPGKEFFQTGLHAFSGSQNFYPPHIDLANVQPLGATPFTDLNYLLIRKPLPKIELFGEHQRLIASFANIRPYVVNDKLTINFMTNDLNNLGFRFNEVKLTFRK